MALRPAWTIKDGKVIRQDFEFSWNGGFALSQKQKNILALHQAIKDATGQSALEISSKSTEELGRKLSAFFLKLSGVYLENIFQAAKKYELGGPYLDLLEVSPKEAKQDERHKTSGKLVSFVKDGEEWPLEPKTAFYDFIYVSAVIENFGYDLDLSAYDWFTDIEFNPKRSINCQARALAIYKALQLSDGDKRIIGKTDWVSFQEEIVKG